MDEGYIELVNAIILQTFKDYSTAERKLKRDPTNPEAIRLINDIERFCRSEWFEMMTDLDGGWLLERIKYGIIHPNSRKERTQTDAEDGRSSHE